MRHFPNPRKITYGPSNLFISKRPISTHAAASTHVCEPWPSADCIERSHLSLPCRSFDSAMSVPPFHISRNCYDHRPYEQFPPNRWSMTLLNFDLTRAVKERILTDRREKPHSVTGHTAKILVRFTSKVAHTAGSRYRSVFRGMDQQDECAKLRPYDRWRRQAEPATRPEGNQDRRFA